MVEARWRLMIKVDAVFEMSQARFEGKVAQ
jgi:hypothetical protein